MDVKYSFVGPLNENEDNLAQEVMASIALLIEYAEDNKEALNIDTGIAEINIKGIDYQIQLSMIADKRMWCKDGHTRYSECTKIVE